MYEELGENTGDVVILGAASPATEENPNTQEQSEEAVKEFLSENGYTYPTILDRDGKLFGTYGIYSLPATFFILPDGTLYGYYPGMMTKEDMVNFINQTLEKAGLDPVESS